MKRYSVTIEFIPFEEAMPPNNRYVLLQRKDGSYLMAFHEKGHFWDSDSSKAMGVAYIDELKGWSLEEVIK